MKHLTVLIPIILTTLFLGMAIAAYYKNNTNGLIMWSMLATINYVNAYATLILREINNKIK
jgi:hypothetical protein